MGVWTIHWRERVHLRSKAARGCDVLIGTSAREFSKVASILTTYCIVDHRVQILLLVRAKGFTVISEWVGLTTAFCFRFSNRFRQDALN